MTGAVDPTIAGVRCTIAGLETLDSWPNLPSLVILIARLDRDLTGDWDADRLIQVASNLVGNALEHGEPGAPVQVRADGSASAMCVGVSVPTSR